MAGVTVMAYWNGLLALGTNQGMVKVLGQRLEARSPRGTTSRIRLRGEVAADSQRLPHSRTRQRIEGGGGGGTHESNTVTNGKATRVSDG